MKILRITAVLDETGHRSQTSIYQLVKDGLFPRPVRIGRRAVGWPLGEVHTINAARVAAFSDEQLRELVNQLHSRRSSFLVPPAI
ncbi:AlpA family phage regulatory protein [Curvibacter sp. AEP1-3]|uniref:helix-turn-helix transcriptional regulator n=1 Tax=Curvibacter sp. AEP1-3 TaxID=1844971 RepID=UPI000B3CAC3B